MGGDLVVSAAKVLDEGVAGNDGLGCGRCVIRALGEIHAARVETAKYQDIAWVGRCTHTAAQLAKLAQPYSVASSVDVLADGADSIDGLSDRLLRRTTPITIGGQSRNIVMLGVTEVALFTDPANPQGAGTPVLDDLLRP